MPWAIMHPFGAMKCTMPESSGWRTRYARTEYGNRTLSELGRQNSQSKTMRTLIRRWFASQVDVPYGYWAPMWRKIGGTMPFISDRGIQLKMKATLFKLVGNLICRSLNIEICWNAISAGRDVFLALFLIEGLEQVMFSVIASNHRYPWQGYRFSVSRQAWIRNLELRGFIHKSEKNQTCSGDGSPERLVDTSGGKSSLISFYKTTKIWLQNLGLYGAGPWFFNNWKLIGWGMAILWFIDVDEHKGPDQWLGLKWFILKNGSKFIDGYAWLGTLHGYCARTTL